MDTSIVLGLVAVVLLVAAIVVLKGGSKGEAAGAPGAGAAEAVASAPPEPAAPNGPMQIFFGSQTGTAEGFAKTISDEAKRRGFAPKIVDLEDFEPEEMEDASWRAGTMVFAMANPDPEITPTDVKDARSDAICATGRSAQPTLNR